jgi:hypothetical protein
VSQVIIDEQIHVQQVFEALSAWTTVQRVPKLRPGSVIKDEVIPHLLRHHKRATFITINVKDFWKPKLCDHRYCIICFSVPDPKQHEIPKLLRRLFHLPEFKTRAARMGKIVHVTLDHIRYYQAGDEKMYFLRWPPK